MNFSTGMRRYWFILYCKYEVLDHKVGIYCNVIGPLAALRHMHFRAKRF